MLVITRKLGEHIYLGDDIEISFLGYDRGQIKVAIKAPRTLAINREPPRGKNKNGRNKKRLPDD